MVFLAYSGRYHPANPVPERTEAEGGEPAGRQSHARQEAVRKGGPVPGLSGILKKIEAVGMETDDLLLALILYLMYRESGDKDLLILLGAMLLS